MNFFLVTKSTESFRCLCVWFLVCCVVGGLASFLLFFVGFKKLAQNIKYASFLGTSSATVADLICATNEASKVRSGSDFERIVWWGTRLNGTVSMQKNNCGNCNENYALFSSISYSLFHDFTIHVKIPEKRALPVTTKTTIKVHGLYTQAEKQWILEFLESTQAIKVKKITYTNTPLVSESPTSYLWIIQG